MFYNFLYICIENNINFFNPCVMKTNKLSFENHTGIRDIILI